MITYDYKKSGAMRKQTRAIERTIQMQSRFRSVYSIAIVFTHICFFLRKSFLFASGVVVLLQGAKIVMAVQVIRVSDSITGQSKVVMSVLAV